MITTVRSAGRSFVRLTATAVWIVSALALEAAPAEVPRYREPFRPQFHFTPERNWMNDPNGMVFFDGEYHLFYQYNPFGDRWGHMSWGHAISRDLVRWEHLPVALIEEDGVMIFSGSAVVDWNNSSGFGREGKPPLVAIYTGHYTQKPLQNQQIAYSNDRGRTWTKYAGNPVLDIGEKDFRDPKVFWHEPAQRWIMVVAWPVQRQVRFYASTDLKAWSHLSDFGPSGSVRGIWECPDLFPLAIEGAAGRSKWVLIVNVGSGAPAGGSGCQYFVGDFDGHQFALDTASQPAADPEFVPEGQLLTDFEGEDYGGWRSSGAAFGQNPARGSLGDQQPVAGFRGRGLVNSFLGGDAAEGTLTSPEFEVSHNYLSLLVGGGNHAGKTCVNLLVDGKVVRTVTGENIERLGWRSWDVRDWRGRTARLEIVDQHTGGWGHINVDHILLANQPARPAGEPALWADYGRDFYAAVSWSDIPKKDGRRLWIGWMSNWEYAQDVPTAPWRSAMTVPRELALRETPQGFRFVQRAVTELQSLRNRRHQLENVSLAQAHDWLQKLQLNSELMEIAVEFELIDKNAHFVLESRTGEADVLRLGCNLEEGHLYVDRTQSGRVDFHPRFGGVHEAPLRVVNGRLRLEILFDTSSVEVFARGGEAVLSELFFPQPGRRRLGLISSSGVPPKVASLDLWELKSAW